LARSKGSSVLRDTFQSVRRILYIPVLISLVYGLLRLAGPLFMILMFDRVLPSRSEATLVSLLLLLVIVLVAMTLLDYSRRRLLARFRYSAPPRATPTSPGVVASRPRV
jgi:ABC-type protease/lipase transport system fused ATPase/permease subunit